MFFVGIEISTLKHFVANAKLKIFTTLPSLEVALKVSNKIINCKNLTFIILGPFSVNTTVCPQCSPFTHHVPLVCNCYTDLKSNFYSLKENSVQFKEKLDEVLKINETKSSISNNNFDITAQKNVLKNKTTFEDGECSLNILDERERKKSNDVEMKVFRIIKKGKKLLKDTKV